jgi:hypothetical protein
MNPNTKAKATTKDALSITDNLKIQLHHLARMKTNPKANKSLKYTRDVQQTDRRNVSNPNKWKRSKDESVTMMMMMMLMSA